MPVTQGDELWDVESDRDSSDDSEVEPASKSACDITGRLDVKSVAQKRLVALAAEKHGVTSVLTIAPPSMISVDSETESGEGSDTNDVLPSRQMSSLQPQKHCAKQILGFQPQKHSAKQILGASQLVMRLPPPEAAPKSSKGLVAYLRQENDWLRNALSQLHQETEKTASQQASGGHAALDFAHLLELAREFGEGPPKGGHQESDDWYGDDASTVGPVTMSMATPESTPRGDHQHPSLDATELQAQLSESRREIEALKAQLFERDSQLAVLCSTSLDAASSSSVMAHDARHLGQ